MKTLVFCGDDEAKKEAMCRFRLNFEDVVCFSEIKKALNWLILSDNVSLILIDSDMPKGRVFFGKF